MYEEVIGTILGFIVSLVIGCLLCRDRTDRRTGSGTKSDPGSVGGDIEAAGRDAQQARDDNHRARDDNRRAQSLLQKAKDILDRAKHTNSNN